MFCHTGLHVSCLGLMSLSLLNCCLTLFAVLLFSRNKIGHYEEWFEKKRERDRARDRVSQILKDSSIPGVEKMHS